MPITMHWLDGRNDILVTSFSQEWTLEDFYANLDQAERILTSVDHPFVSIADFTHSSTPPRKILSIGRRVQSARRPNRVALIFVNFGTLAQMIYRSLARIYPSAFEGWYHAHSLQDAVALADRILEAKKKDEPYRNGASL